MTQKNRRRGFFASNEGMKKLQARMNEKGYIQEQLATQADVSIDQVKRLLNPHWGYKVQRDAVEKIAHALDLTPTDIVASHEWYPPQRNLEPEQIRTNWNINRVHSARVFISHCIQEPDFSVAQQISESLKADGKRVFLKNETETDWRHCFDEELEQCDCLIFLLSPQASVSEMVTEGIRRARDLQTVRPNRKPQIVPIHIGESKTLNHDLRGYLQGIQAWEWRTPTDTPKLVQVIINLLAGDQVQVKDKPLEALSAVSPLPIVIAEERPLPVAEPELPVGQVGLASAFYIERPPIETRCYQEVLQPGALIRIKAPRQMGKTSLMARILYQAREQGYRTVTLSFQLASSEVFTSLDKFLRWFCACIGQSLRLSNQLADYWDDIFDSSYNTTTYFEDYLLAKTDSCVAIGLDEVDRIFSYPEIANDFFGLLRAWYEKAKYGDYSSDIWKKLRLVVVHSTEVYIPMNINQSPFNVGLAIDLPEFSSEQVKDLAQRHRLDWKTDHIKQLINLVGGQPYLVRLAMYHITSNDITLAQLLQTAPTEAGPYSDHLRRHLWNLEQYPELGDAFSEVVATNKPVELKPTLAFKLYSMGMVKKEGNYVIPRCDLYRQYFQQRLPFTDMET
ncbi:AAA-like domain-containing protein [Nostoc parmelioides]|uniref:AAA-like domain-containing protein n=1 Tax=Nostoc parmelioides FACHB-3921 TaxID=2692909 RepID=A0ABR8BNN7_9NOSO|nr:AAA-like domain-containing protein [Nostoc parmelioides]MBD2255229.1 AAA-like domain-containing protein [Nostoc parmelioides FACHB-3921]